tara:strand:- start:122 stop:364 length:243 start_codon:yes stop_codon:yes gene_type:complete
MNKEKQLDKKIKNLEFVKGAITRENFIILMRLGVNEISELPTGLKKHCLAETKRANKILKKLRKLLQTKMNNLNQIIQNS